MWSASDARLVRSLRAPSVTADDGVADDQAILGQLLFWEKRLSRTGGRSCASCHNPRHGWSDGRTLPRGRGLRHTPTLWNVASNEWFFWDGRADSLAAQALDPIESVLELRGHRDAVAKLMTADQNLRTSYERAFGRAPVLHEGSASYASDIDRVFANVGRALAAFERRIVSTNSPFDRFAEGFARDEGPPADFSLAAQQGLKLFIGRAGCIRCHKGPSFSDGEFHNTGLASAEEERSFGGVSGETGTRSSPAVQALSRHSPDERERLARGRRTRGEFKTPTLRNIAETGPYMHDGRFATLREVLTYYSTLSDASFDQFGVKPPIQPLHLSEGELDDLVEFLKSLTGSLADRRWGAQPGSAANERPLSVQ